MKKTLFTTIPFPPLFCLLQLFSKGEVYIEAMENYQKKSLRNKYIIISNNGYRTLSIPLKSGKSRQCPIKDVRIAYDEPWDKVHLKSLKAAYGNSAFYEHYEAELERILNRRFEFLWDFNWHTWNFLMASFYLESVELKETEIFNIDQDEHDFRSKSWSEEKHLSLIKQYRPRYEEEFQKNALNISSLDLLFLRGPEALSILHHYTSIYGND